MTTTYMCFVKKYGRYMNYQKLGDGLMNAILVCPTCTKRVREETAYNKINQQNNSWLKSNEGLMSEMM